MYFNEIREITGMSISSLQNALLKLELSNGVIKIKKKGNVFYQLDYKEYIILSNPNGKRSKIKILHKKCIEII